ncbi:MAG: hypothetical protein NBV68_18965 [Erythrobacter sp.]|uniref:hypothetical protein n=1 Tax=Erythrobacter sp. TaxID=1042 RepID=UPI0025E32D8A|nr:hypothetical protein [Erythrobacter sp.]MCM0001458.1 hypothetical protein [Erythrobacter sp.]
MKRRVALLLALAALAAPLPAEACSFRWAKGSSPREIPRRADVFAVRGEFRFVDGRTGEEIPDDASEIWPEPGMGELLGRIVRKNGKIMLTRQYYSEFAVDCQAYLAPLTAGTGRFWLEKRRSKDGRYRILMWKPD